MKNLIKAIRISLFSILLLMFSGYMITEHIDNMKTRFILFILLFIAIVILAVILLKSSICTFPRLIILDFLSLVILIGLMGTFWKGVSEIGELQNSIQGNNGFLFSYSKDIGSKGYEDLESAVKDIVEYRGKHLEEKEMKEIYRAQVENKEYIYLKEPESVTELEFFRQDDLYYYSGSKVLTYVGVGSSDSYTITETMKKDIANTMWRGVGSEKGEAPAWGVSDDEQIFSVTINDKEVDNIIPIDKNNGKNYYFWIMLNADGIGTIDDVKEIKIEVKK